METTDPPKSPQIKICGLTRVEDAVKSAQLGADAIGMVFYKNSPRYVTPEKAKAICRALPGAVAKVGVFVNEPLASLVHIAFSCGLTVLQLHGNEPPKFVRELMDQGFPVIKSLYIEARPSIAQADSYGASAYLVECTHGVMPGGNAMAWNWRDAADSGKTHPLVLAGGLTPENVTQAIEAAMPDAVDVSSGVESTPGKKDMYQIRQFIEAVQCTVVQRELRRIFR